jgi:hypothetical protein
MANSERVESSAPSMARIQELLDENDIREKLYRYCRGADRFDAGLISSVYWPDAWDEHGPAGTLRGVECADVLIGRMRATYKLQQHHLTNILIDLRGDTAYVESYLLSFLVIERNGRDVTRSLGGRYVDRFERRKGEWRIAHRVMVHDWSRLDDVVEDWPPGKLNFVQGERGDHDMAYTIERGVEEAHARVPGAKPLSEFRGRER